MRTLFLIVSLLLVIPASAQTREKREVGKFSIIAFRIPGKIFLQPGPVTSVEIAANPDLLKRIETKVTDDKLVIQPVSVRDWKDKGDFDNIRIYITLPKLNGIHVDGSGHVRNDEPFQCADLDLDVSGSGTIYLKADAAALVTEVAGSGTIDFSGSATGIKANIGGSGSIVVKGLKSGAVDAKISGSGDLTLAGTADDLRTVIAGSGNVKAFDLSLKSAKIRIAGSGSVFVNVSESLESDIAGSGSVKYKGSPSKVNTRAGGSGKVMKAED